MKIVKYAAIDIGSNAIKILIINALTSKKEKPTFIKNSMLRLPIRLGTDVFTQGYISDKNIKNMAEGMKTFKLIMKINEVKKYRACGTSALREASNRNEIVEEIYKKTKIKIDLIDGEEEAELISSSIFNFAGKKKAFLYVDVGGGSTEFSIITQGKRILSKSFKIGTVRALENRINPTIWNEIEEWIVSNTNGIDKISILGSGGNINKVSKILANPQNRPIKVDDFNHLYQKLNNLNFEERMRQYELKPDRADVILHAMDIFSKAIKWSNASKLYVPRIGLSDGIIRELYYNDLESKS